MRQLFCIFITAAMLTACHDSGYEPGERPYGINYNFLVTVDSIDIIKQQPEEYVSDLPADTLTLYRDDRIVIADLRAVPSDTIDSMFVQVARDQQTIGWTHETQLMDSVVPDDPISVFIYTFSASHVPLTLGLVCLIIIAYTVRIARKKKVKMVHLNDIPSPYPTLLCLTVAATATLYSTIQQHAPETWFYFYHNPTLNPLSQPLPTAVFLTLVWIMVLLAIASADAANSMLNVGETLLYLAALAAVCATDYIVFSLATVYYDIGYILLALYIIFAVRRYVRYSRRVYRCGACGALLRRKGRCPKCGTMNE